MKAMVLKQMGDLKDNREPLVWMDWPDPEPGHGELLIKVSTCGVCHTELDEIEGRTPPPRFPIILGHQAVGRVAGFGAGTIRFKINDRKERSGGPRSWSYPAVELGVLALR